MVVDAWRDGYSNRVTQKIKSGFYNALKKKVKLFIFCKIIAIASIFDGNMPLRRVATTRQLLELLKRADFLIDMQRYRRCGTTVIRAYVQYRHPIAIDRHRVAAAGTSGRVQHAMDDIAIDARR